jgi:predicted ester cyclase
MKEAVLPKADNTTIERNLAAARRFVEGVLGGADPEAFMAVVHQDVVVDTGLKPVGKITGRAEYGQILGATLGAAFSNGRMEIKDIAPLVDGRVLVRFEASAENTGPLNGVEATQQRFTFAELHLMRFEDGMLIENWVGALNPLMFEMWQAPVIAPQVLAQSA